MPPIKSRYFFPDASNKYIPSAFTISRASGEGEVCATCLKNNSRLFIAANVAKNSGYLWGRKVFCKDAKAQRKGLARFPTVPSFRNNLPIMMLKPNRLSTVQECDARM